MTSISSLRLLVVATFCSGGCALLLEQIYEKYLSTLLGASRPAATIVLATFFLGLAIGGAACPKRVRGATRRLAVLELFIAAWAVLVGFGFFASYDTAARWLASAGADTTAVTGVRFALATFWILPPTIAMGAQLPTLAAVLDALQARTAENLTRYYAINLFGGFAFTILAPVVLFNYLGADGALWFAAGLSAVVGAALWFGVRPAFNDAATHRVEIATAEPILWSELILAAVSGFVFFALEVIWFHLISTVCGASTYSFSILLAAVLLGLTLSGWYLSRLPPQSLRDPGDALLRTLARLLPLLAVSSAAWPHLARVLSAVQTRVQLESFWAGESLKFSIIALTVVPVAAGLGMVFPLLLRGVDGRGAPGSRRVGWICAANVIGCVSGALAAGYLFIRHWGAEHTLRALWLLILGAVALLAWRSLCAARRTGSLGWIAAGCLAVIALPRWDLLELTRGIGVYLRDGMPRDARLIFFHEDDHAGFVTVTESGGQNGDPVIRTLLQNGKFDADDGSQMSAQIGIGLLGALHAPAFGNALVIGCGSGQTASVVARFDFERVEIVEMSPGHLLAARQHFASINHGVFDDPRVTTVVEDGRNWLLRTPARYDLIQIEVSSVWFAGATNLYAKEFYDLVRDRLTPGGVLVQWIQLHHLSSEHIYSIIGTIATALPEISVWQVGLQACILASTAPQQWNPRAVDLWQSAARFETERQVFGAASSEMVKHNRLLAPERVSAFLRRHEFVVNTDRNRWLEFHTPKLYLSRRDHVAENLALFGTGEESQ